MELVTIMPRDANTAKYVVHLVFDIDEKNQYGDVIGTSTVTFSMDTNVKDLAQLGQLMSRVQYAVANKTPDDRPFGSGQTETL